MRNIVIALTLVLATACASQKTTEAPAPVAKPLPQSLTEAVNSNFRTEKNKERDSARHPQQTLEFFEIAADQTVIEISPSGGWYTQILAPFLAEKGRYIGAVGSVDLSGKYDKDLKTWTEQYPEITAKMTFVEFSAPDHLKLGEANSADRVLTFRNVHNWMKNKNEKKYFKAFFEVLKPGGILGVVEHRAGKNQKQGKGESGYVSEKAIIAIAKQAGFKLVEKSEINANPKDTKNHPEGVWTLPPTLRLGDKDREKYLAIGESDRMTLKFVKPTK